MPKAITVSVLNSYSQIHGLWDQDMINALDASMSFGIEGAEYSDAYKNNNWDGKQHLFNRKNLSFPTGLLSDVKAHLLASGYTILTQDNRPEVELGAPIPLRNGLWPHGEAALEVMAGEGRGIVQIATGGGKTRVIAATLGLFNCKSLVLTQKVDLLYQIKASLEESLGVPIGILGDGKWEYQPITIAMVQSLASIIGDAKATFYAERKKLSQEDSDTDAKTLAVVKGHEKEIYDLLINKPSLVCADELHRFASKWGYKIIQSMTGARYRFGFSATAYGFRPDKKDYLNKAAFGHPIVSVTASDLVDKNILVPIHILKYEYSHGGCRYPRKGGYSGFYNNAVINNDLRNQVIVSTAAEMYKNRDNVLIAVTSVDHGKILEAALQEITGKDSARFLHGLDESEVRTACLGKFKKGHMPVLISTLMGEGVDMPNLSHIINCRGEESAISVIQLLGRAMRTDPNNPNKKRAVCVDIADVRERWLEEHTASRELIYGTERAYVQHSIRSHSELCHTLKTI